jgi:hypothetical protein
MKFHPIQKYYLVKPKHVDSVCFHNFTISFIGFHEYSNVNIKVNIFYISWILQLSVW